MPPIMTGLSGNEIYCLGLKGFSPGELVVGNSVHSLGFLGGLGAGLKGIMGGEVAQVTEIIREGRLQSHARIMQEAKEFGAHGVTGVTSELRHMQGNVEFLSVGSCVHSPATPAPARAFSSSSNGQELFSPDRCRLHAQAIRHRQRGLFGRGRGRPVRGAQEPRPRRDQGIQRRLQRHPPPGAAPHQRGGARGRRQCGDRHRDPHHAVSRRARDADAGHRRLSSGARAGGAGGASGHSAQDRSPATSPARRCGTWPASAIMPLKLVLGTAVYSLGFVGGVMAMFKGMARGEISELTSLIYDAREHAIGLLRDEANAHRGRRRGRHHHPHPRARRPDRVHGDRHRGQAPRRRCARDREPAGAGHHPRQGHLDQRRRSVRGGGEVGAAARSD